MAAEQPGIGELVGSIGHDMKTIVTAEAELSKRKLTAYLDNAVLRGAIMILGAFVALIGFAMLCVVAVLALRPWITLIWPRLLIMGVFYIVVGSLAARLFATRVIGRLSLRHQVEEVKQTAEAVKDGLKH